MEAQIEALTSLALKVIPALVVLYYGSQATRYVHLNLFFISRTPNGFVQLLIINESYNLQVALNQSIHKTSNLTSLTFAIILSFLLDLPFFTSKL